MAIKKVIVDNKILTHCKTLGITIPSVPTFLPNNLLESSSTDEFIYEASIRTLRKILKENDFAELPLEPPGTSINALHQKDITWIAPTLFFMASSLLNNPNIVAIYLNIISAYLYDYFKNSQSKINCKIKILVEKTPNAALEQFEYEGDIAGLKGFEKIIRDIHHA